MNNSEYDERILQKLIEKAKAKGCDGLFVLILENKPLYPLNHTDHEIDEFGGRVKFCGDSAKTGLKQGHIGYVLGKAHPVPGIRENGWHEVVFPYVTHDCWPDEIVNGLKIDVDFKIDQ